MRRASFELTVSVIVGSLVGCGGDLSLGNHAAGGASASSGSTTASSSTTTTSTGGPGTTTSSTTVTSSATATSSSSGGGCDAGIVGTSSYSGGVAWGDCCTAQGGFYNPFSSGDCVGICGGTCYAKPTPSAHQFTCGYLACNDGQVCTITIPNGDGAARFACGSSLCEGAPPSSGSGSGGPEGCTCTEDAAGNTTMTCYE